MMSFLVPRKETRHTLIIEKSKFIATLLPVSDAQYAQAQIARIAKEFSDATHNCYAYIADPEGREMRFSDDGEPQGTAGLPMLGVLQTKNIKMTLCVVTRYFGGVKLGANGLVSAYQRAVIEAVDAAVMAERSAAVRYSVSVDFRYADRIKKRLSEAGAIVESARYDCSVHLQVLLKVQEAPRIEKSIVEMSAGSAKMTELETLYADF